MGRYADNLAKRMKEGKRKPPPIPDDTERLKSAAIIRAGILHAPGFRSHYQVRQAIDPDDMNPNFSRHDDIEGFVTSTGRFVDRAEAQNIALESGQISRRQGRSLLSSDINW